MQLFIMEKQMSTESCKHCNKLFTELLSGEHKNARASHIRWCKLNPNRKVNKHSLPKQCIKCGCEFISRRRTCSEKCQNTRSTETKNLISEKRKKFLADNPEKHPWKKPDKFTSVPCQNVKKYLDDKGTKYVDELTPLPDRAFSIDIAFPHIMVGIEINGNQHYERTGELKPYYRERHELIEAAGWTLIEVHYSQCFNDVTIAKFLNFEIPYDSQGIIESYFSQRKVKPESLPRGQKVRTKSDAKWEPVKNVIFDQSIDFTKYGWSAKVADVLNMKPQKVNGWMKRYHLEFYETMCFKRKTKLI
jgi:hypothetical protein